MKRMFLYFALFNLLTASSIWAKTASKTIVYQEGETTLEGYIAYPDLDSKKKVPGVLVVHDWMGLSENSKMRADKLAGLGYVALAVDIYGKGVRPKAMEEAAKLANSYKQDRKLMRARILAALETLKSQPEVDTNLIAAIGYCFGGTVALELARSGAPVQGTVSFHGGLATPNVEDAKNIKGKVLALHGADDPFVKKEEVETFQDEMRKAGVDWQFISYGGAVHSFTIKDAGNDNSKGAAYNAKADRRSWNELLSFFREVFPKSKE
ncbi:dienelactone hydrolase family protein [Leptospira kmetyi]|uniref:Dienelactone hydrolase family protein n=1 Tax=Leptospira kmetyi TaxID=408139 RepID=A0ABX4NFJ9_9LEPT|nr:dienelactone hydrolase family protein [Leptospira kmetyi]EQA55243.1 dienelactone hydrolase family protein [Leptospira kmetyi serovar Malaysia str. Bejo-Iso9]PJZ30260.1 dienelactone hydrolase family protein [Leptospira kmetyi]PJZ40036.1 dienelactone hydrolase family protein [Leptospira kmetyi]TGK19454.1 dienelactone hydrolase family protein [Leptospira kmetyi]TGK32844.1 dienelactone hydrolase family protein [Leptospira kmetyi]